jgi:hypothetical protein
MRRNPVPTSTTRRTVLTGAIAGLGAWAASAVAGRSPAVATDGQPILQGQDNGGSATTLVRSNSATAFQGLADASSGAAYGVRGRTNSIAGHGVVGQSFATSGESDGVFGSTNSSQGSGVRGQGPGAGVTGVGGGMAGVGVWGEANTNAGVYATSNSGSGVSAHSGSGSAVYAASSAGVAILTRGRMRFEHVSGVTTIAAGSTSKTVTPTAKVTSSSFVFLTPKANIGSRALWFTTDPANNHIRVRMSAPRSSDTRVAWLMLG